MTVTLIRNGLRAEYDPTALEESRQWSGDAKIIADLEMVMARYDQVTLPHDLTIPFGQDTPLHNVLASALYLGMGIGDGYVETTPEFHPLPANPEMSVTRTESEVSAYASVITSRSDESAHVTRIIPPTDLTPAPTYTVPTPVASVIPVPEPVIPASYTTPSAYQAPVTEAPVPPASYTAPVTQAPVPQADYSAPVSEAASYTAPVSEAAPSLELGDDDPLQFLRSALSDGEDSLFSSMVREMGLDT
jgi:hypothetical protein